MMNGKPFFSVVMCSIDAWRFANASERYKTLLADYPHEIIGIRDARSLAEGYNRGFSRSRGDIVIFSHDDVLFLDQEFASKIAGRIKSWDLLGFAGSSRVVGHMWANASWPYLYGAVCHWGKDKNFQNYLRLNFFGLQDWPVTGGIQVLDGLCLIARRDLAETLKFDEWTFDAFHLYDIDFSFSAHLAGYRLGVCCDMPYIHASTGKAGFASEDYRVAARRFLQKHAKDISLDTPKRLVTSSCGMQSLDMLLKLWNEAAFRRAAIAIERRQAFNDLA